MTTHFARGFFALAVSLGLLSVGCSVTVSGDGASRVMNAYLLLSHTGQPIGPSMRPVGCWASRPASARWRGC